MEKKSLNRMKIVLVIILLPVTITLNAQTKSYPVNIETVMKLAGANSLTIQEYQLRYQYSMAEYSKAKEWWLPTVYAGVTTHFLNGSAMNTDGQIFHPVNRNNLWAGLGLSVEWDFGNGIYTSLAAKQKAEATKYYAKAEQNQVILKAIIAYYDLQVEELKFTAIQELVALSDTLIQQIKIQVDAGLRYESEYLLAQSNYNHLRISLVQTKAEWQKKSLQLKNILNLDENVLLTSSDSALLPLELIQNTPDTSHVNIFEKRPEYFGMQADLLALETQRKSATTGMLLPDLRLGTDNGMFGKVQSPYYYTYQFNVGLVWELPLGRVFYNGDIKQYDAKIQIQQNEIEQFKNISEQEVEQATFQWQAAKEQMLLAGESLKLSAEALKQSTERQKLGTAKPFEVFQAQQFYMQAQVDYLSAVSLYNQSQYMLMVATGSML